MSKNVFLSLLVLIFLFACSTPQKYECQLNSMIGKSQQDVLEKFGYPSAQIMHDNGSLVYAYTTAEDIRIPSEYYLYPHHVDYRESVYGTFLSAYDYTPFEQAFGYPVTKYCQTSILIENGRVAGWKWYGNDCRSH